MTSKHSISEEQLNAFIDNELDDSERLQVLEALREDEALSRHVAELQHDKELLRLVYRDPPLPRQRNPFPSSQRPHYLAVAASVLILVASLSAFIGYYMSRPDTTTFENLATLKPNALPNDHILIHINSMDADRVSAVLDRTTKILETTRLQSHKPELEIVANAEGLGLLRAQSPYADKIHELVASHKNVKFLACGIAMETARLKEGKPVELLPDAQRVPAALEQILLRLREGWTYVRG